jgi:hypothetical protein
MGGRGTAIGVFRPDALQKTMSLFDCAVRNSAHPAPHDARGDALASASEDEPDEALDLSAARIGATTLIAGGTTSLIGHAVAALVVVHVVRSVPHHVVRGLASAG